MLWWTSAPAGWYSDLVLSVEDRPGRSCLITSSTTTPRPPYIMHQHPTSTVTLPIPPHIIHHHPTSSHIILYHLNTVPYHPSPSQYCLVSSSTTLTLSYIIYYNPNTVSHHPSPPQPPPFKIIHLHLETRMHHYYLSPF